MISPRNLVVLLAGLAAGLLPGPPAMARAAAPFEKDILAFEAADRANRPPAGAILLAGDSQFTRWKTVHEDLPEYRIINRGFGGSRMSDLLRYTDRIVLPYKPRMIVVNEGGNDIHSGRTPEQIMADITNFVARVRSVLPDTPIVFSGLTASPARWSETETRRRYNRMLRKYVASGKKLVYLDLFDAYLGDDGKPREELFVADKLHHSSAGYAIRMRIMRPVLGPPDFPAARLQAGVAPADTAARPGLFDLQNLTAWCVVPFDARKRGPAQRAEMLRRLGFKNFAYDWRSKDVPDFDAEVEALNQHGINMVAWWFPTDAGDPNAKIILEVIKRHGIHPQLWVMGSGNPAKTQAEQAQRADQEAERIRKIVELANPFGCKVELYNHNGWFGQPDNEVAVIERLKEKGIGDVGMVYNFSHGHKDMADFPAIWKRIEPYVVAVNVSGMTPSERLIPPSQGEKELDMLRTIEDSGWRGPIGVIAEQGGDAEITLSNDLRGLDWLSKEIAHPGSAGDRPVLAAPAPDTK